MSHVRIGSHCSACIQLERAYGKAGNGNGKLKWKLLHGSV